MTQEQFKAQRFTNGMVVSYMGENREVAMVNFREYLIGLGEGEEIEWVRCENCELIN